MDRCKCGRLVDTDEDGDAYFVRNEDGTETHNDFVTCVICKEEPPLVALAANRIAKIGGTDGV